MITKLDVKNSQLAKEIINIQVPAYQEEAMIIDFYEIPPLIETVDMLQQCEEVFYGYFINKKLVGVIAYEINDSVLDIHRLFVHPNYFRQGIAKKLLKYVQDNEDHVEKMIVSTGSNNDPAVIFYQNNGFVKRKEEIMEEGISISHFEKRNEFINQKDN